MGYHPYPNIQHSTQYLVGNNLFDADSVHENHFILQLDYAYLKYSSLYR